MLVFRAANKYDRKSIKNNVILSTARIDRQEDLEAKEKREFIRQKSFIEGSIQYILSFVIGHAGGNLLNNSRSPYISLTKCINVALEYAFLEKYEFCNEKLRPVICFEVDESKIIRYKDDLVFDDFQVLKNGYLLDISEKETSLFRYFKLGVIPTIGQVEELIQKKCERALKISNKIKQGYFGVRDKELLAFDQIKLEDYVLLTTELLEELKENPDKRKIFTDDMKNANTLDDVKKIINKI